MQDVLSPGRAVRKENKRSKLESPITSLLRSIQLGSNSRTLCHHLQSLLFFVDRHWSLLHNSLKQDVIDVLLQYVAYSDPVVQSWVFLNFAAVAYAEGTKTSPGNSDGVDTLDEAMWESIWTHAVRRANAPTTCRAACHTSQTILTCLYSRTSRSPGSPLGTSKILGEIETLTKDMDVQGPSYPFDSVCIFLSHCLQIASQDARLYRMRLEDKVLTWLIDSWKVVAGRARMAPYLIGDILLLLETICNFTKRAQLLAWPSIPDCQIVDTVVEESKVKVIQDFVLYAKIPSFSHCTDTSTKSSLQPSPSSAKADNIDLISPRPKERKISSFLSKVLESFLVDSESNQGHARAETCRQHLDIAVTAALFEALLVTNGINCNRTVLQTAGKVITSCTKLLARRHWSHSEKLFVAQGLEPLIYDEEIPDEGSFWEAMPRPGPDSGIKKDTLRHLVANMTGDKDMHSSGKLALLQIIWQNIEVCACLLLHPPHLMAFPDARFTTFCPELRAQCFRSAFRCKVRRFKSIKYGRRRERWVWAYSHRLAGVKLCCARWGFWNMYATPPENIHRPFSLWTVFTIPFLGGNTR